jgi:hypothetical protein
MNEQRLEIVFTNALQIMEVSEPPSVHQWMTVTYERFTLTMEGSEVMYTLPVDHSVSMQVGYTDSRGNPATIDGEVAWESSDPSIIMAEVDETDSTKCRAVPVGTLGQVQITATVDADIGEGVRELITTCDIKVVGGEAVAGSIQPVGEPEQMP